MALNASDGFNQPLELFSGMYQDMSPTDVPAGLSPDNQDVVYLPGNVGTRPALNKTLTAPPEADADILSLTEFAMPSGDYLTLWLSSEGNLWQQDDETLITKQIGAVSPGSKFCSVTAFQKQFFAFRNPTLSAAFSESPFAGVDVPQYYDGKSMWRVTQDAPGANPVFSNLPTLPIALALNSLSGSVTVTGVVSSGPRVYGGKTIYTTITYTCSTPPSPSWIGNISTVTGITGSNSSLVNVSAEVIAVSGSTYTTSYGTGSTFVSLTGLSGAATIGGEYFSRSANIVTAYTGSNAPSAFNIVPGLYVQVSNTDGDPINGGTISVSAIARDSTGLATVTLSSQLTNLPSGTVLYLAITDTTNFPAGYQTVYQVLSSAAGSTTFTISNPTWGTGAVASSSGSLYQTWSGIFQALSTGTDASGNNYFTYFQLGPDTTLDSVGGSGSGQAQIQAQVPPGPRSAVLMFKSVNGAITAPSVPIQLSIAGGTNLLSSTVIPLGPPGTAQRIIALTPAYGSSFYYITPAVIPSTAGLSPVLSLGTIINDNTTTSAILDFSDVQLAAGTQIDIQGNNLFDLIVLAPCLGCIEYEDRMGWWGEINDIKNFVNFGFDGGYNPATPIYGPDLCTTGVSRTASLFVPWTNPGDATGGSGYASVTVTPGNFSQYLDAGGFGFAVPSSAIILGISITASVSNTDTSGRAAGVFLNDAATGIGHNIPEAGSPVTMTFGGSGDLWGYAVITPAMVNSPTFLASFSLANPSGSAMLQVNNVQMTVYTNTGLIGAQPLGWNDTTPVNTITPDGNGSLILSPNGLGFAYEMTSGSGFSNNCMISQPAYQDYYGGPIVEPSTSYLIRFLGTLISGPTSGNLFFVLYSPSTSLLLKASIPIGEFQSNTGWITAALSAATPSAIPSDTVFYVTLDGTAITNFTIAIDELEIIDLSQPVLFGQMRLSYFDNEFGYDNETGVLGLDGPAKITAAFKQRSYLYALTDGPMYQTQNNGQTEPDDWGFPAFADECDCFGPGAVTTTEDIAWWAGFSGFRVFSGATPKKLSQEIQPTWDTFNQDLPTNAWVVNDPEERIVYVGFPVDATEYSLATVSVAAGVVTLTLINSSPFTNPDLFAWIQVGGNISVVNSVLADGEFAVASVSTVLNVNPPRRTIATTTVTYLDPEATNGSNANTGFITRAFGHIVLPMSYRSVDSAYNVPDPIHVSYSGKMIATDLCRKWTRWNMPMACGALLTKPSGGKNKQMFFGGESFGNFYSLNPAKYTDDDYGQIFSYYTTYFWLNHEVEQQAPGVGLHRKIDTYLAAYVTGVGQIQPTAFIDNLNNPWVPLQTVWDPVNQIWTTGMPSGLPIYPLSEQQNYDLEWPLNIRGDRIAYKWSALPLPGQTDASFLLQHMVLTSKQDDVTPVRGSVIG